jgi:hypothetical protein
MADTLLMQPANSLEHLEDGTDAMDEYAPTTTQDHGQAGTHQISIGAEVM